MAFLDIPEEMLQKIFGGTGLLGINDLGSAVGGFIPAAMASGGPEAAAAALMGGAIAPQVARQLPLGDIADAVGSVARQGGAAGAVLGALPVARNLPAAAALSAAGGAAGGVMDEREEMLRRLMRGMYT